MKDTELFNPALYVRRANLLPAPFDPHVASIKMWSDANMADDGYNVFVSADLGSEIITINVDGEELDVMFEIKQAEITIHVSRSGLKLGRGYFEIFGNEPTERSPEINRSADTDNALMLELSRSPVAKISRSTKTVEAEKQAGKNDIRLFSHPDIQLLSIGNWRNDKALIGPQIANYMGWRVNPDITDVSGVLARLNVRRNWVKFSNPVSVSGGRIGKILAKLSKSEDKFDRLKTKLFPALLKDLVFLRLQRSNESKTATLAASGLIVEQGGSPSVVQSNERKSEISLPDHLLLRFLNCEPGTENVAYDLIVGEAKQTQKADVSLFLPTAPYSACLEAYLEIRISNNTKETSFDRIKLVERYGTKVVTALSVLGFLVGKPNAIRLVEPFPSANPILGFEATVKRQKIVRVADDYLIEHPNASALELGRKLKVTFGKNWSDGSCQRYGHEIKKWARLESPTLDRKGRPFAIGPQQEVLISKIIRDGGDGREIVRVLSISNMTLANWRKSEANTKFSRKGPWKILV